MKGTAVEKRLKHDGYVSRMLHIIGKYCVAEEIWMTGDDLEQACRLYLKKTAKVEERFSPSAL